MGASKYQLSTRVLPTPANAVFPGGAVRVHDYVPLRDGEPEVDAAGIAVLPIQGGDYEVSAWFADYFANHGFRVLRFERRAEWLDPDRPLETLDKLLLQYVDDVRTELERWRSDALHPSAGLGLFGVSMGAIVGSIVSAQTTVFDAGVFCIGGAGLGEILAVANDPEINAWRTETAQRLGIPESDVGGVLAEELHDIELAAQQPTLPAERTLFVSARFDRVVPYRFNTRLWERHGRPKRLVLPCGHYSAALFVPLIKWRARRWFRRWLAEPR